MPISSDLSSRGIYFYSESPSKQVKMYELLERPRVYSDVKFEEFSKRSDLKTSSTRKVAKCFFCDEDKRLSTIQTYTRIDGVNWNLWAYFCPNCASKVREKFINCSRCEYSHVEKDIGLYNTKTGTIRYPSLKELLEKTSDERTCCKYCYDRLPVCDICKLKKQIFGNVKSFDKSKQSLQPPINQTIPRRRGLEDTIIGEIERRQRIILQTVSFNSSTGIFTSRNELDNCIVTKRVCKDCASLKDYAHRCSECGDIWEKDSIHYEPDMNEHYCLRCMTRADNLGEGISLLNNARALSKKPLKHSKGLGDFLFPIHTGVEIEVEKGLHYFNPGILEETASRLECRIMSDGSLSNGFEVVTPPRDGEELTTVLREMTRTLQQCKCVISSRCGLHTHINARNLHQEDVKKFIRFYLVFENILFDMLPYSRSDNRYCQKVGKLLSLRDVYKTTHLDTIVYRTDSDENGTLARYKRDKYAAERHEVRYSALNVHSYFYRGTLEFRQHSGTVNYIKIKNWINILHSLMNHCQQISEGKIKSLRELDNDEKLRYFKEVILNKELADYYENRVKKFKDHRLVDDEQYVDLATDQELNNLF